MVITGPIMDFHSNRSQRGRLADRIKHIPMSITKKTNTSREKLPCMCKGSNDKIQ